MGNAIDTVNGFETWPDNLKVGLIFVAVIVSGTALAAFFCCICKLLESDGSAENKNSPAANDIERCVESKNYIVKDNELDFNRPGRWYICRNDDSHEKYFGPEKQSIAEWKEPFVVAIPDCPDVYKLPLLEAQY